jgi:hypothetical protein
MSSVKGDYCNIGQFDPSSRTIDSVKEMNRISDMASLLEKIITMVPFFQIFAGRSTYAFAGMVSQGEQVRSSDWQTFSDSLKGVGAIKKKELERVAFQAGYYSIGEEAKFWRCVYNAL